MGIGRGVIVSFIDWWIVGDGKFGVGKADRLAASATPEICYVNAYMLLVTGMSIPIRTEGHQQLSLIKSRMSTRSNHRDKTSSESDK